MIPRSPRRRRPRLVRTGILSCLLAGLLPACSSPDEPPEAPTYARSTHPRISFTWTLPGNYAIEPFDDFVPGWTFHSADAAVEGSLFVGSVPAPFGNREALRRAELRELMDRYERDMRSRMGQLGIADPGTFLTVREAYGRERQGRPVLVRMFDLQLPIINTPAINQVAHWAAAVMGGRGEAAARGNAIRRVQLVVAIAGLHDAFGDPVRDNREQLTAAHAIWALAPDRLPEDSDEFEAGIWSWARALPLATRFASLEAVEQTLAPPAESPRVSLLIVAQRTGTGGGPFNPQEQTRLQALLREAIQQSIQRRVRLDIGFVDGCTGDLFGGEGGADPFVASSDDDFEARVRERLAAMLQPGDCENNPLLRSAVLAVEGQGSRYADAAARWLLLLTRNSDNSPGVEDPFTPASGEVLGARLAQVVDDFWLIGPFEEGCFDSNALAEAGEGKPLPSQLGKQSPRIIEYCQAFDLPLGTDWGLRLAGLAGLQLLAPPLPRSLHVRDAAGPVTEDTVRGYTYAADLGALRPGSLVQIRSDAPWTASYDALIEPSLERLR